MLPKLKELVGHFDLCSEVVQGRRNNDLAVVVTSTVSYQCTTSKGFPDGRQTYLHY